MQEMRRQKEEEMLQKRHEYREKTKNVLLFSDMPSEKKGKGKKVRTDQYVSDSGSEGGDRREDVPREKKRKRKSSTERKTKGKGRKRRVGSGDSAGGNIFYSLSREAKLIDSCFKKTNSKIKSIKNEIFK